MTKHSDLKRRSRIWRRKNKSIRDRIAETKASIEHKKHLLDKARAANKVTGKTYESKIQMDSELTRKSEKSSKTLLSDAQNQLDEAYNLRDKILGAGAVGHTPTIAPQIKMRIEERMGALEEKIDKDIDDNRRVAANIEANLDHAQRAVDDHNYRIDQTKQSMSEIIAESDQLNKDIEREIDERDGEISDNSRKLSQVQKEKQDFKWKIGSLEAEVNSLEFHKSKLDLEVEVRNLKENKGDIVGQLNQRIEDAKYNERHIRDLCNHAQDISIDVGFIEKIDIQGDREFRLRQLRDDLSSKQRRENELKEEVRLLNERIKTIGEVNLDSSTFLYEEDYSNQLKDLKIGYSDIVQSMKDHLSANAAILRKEKEIKEMEARIVLIDLDALDEEYEKLRIQYDRDSEILRDLEDRYSLIHDRLIRLRARLRELNDLIRSLEERLETARFEVSDAERKYALIKIPKKVEYIVNERVEDVVVRKKYVEKGWKISERELMNERRKRTKTVDGVEYYKPSPQELEQMVPQGSRVRFYQDNQHEGYYTYGSKRFYFIKGNDGELYLNYEGDKYHIDDFISVYEDEERSKGAIHTHRIVDAGNIEEEELDAQIGDEMEGISVMNRGLGRETYQRDKKKIVK